MLAYGSDGELWKDNCQLFHLETLHAAGVVTSPNFPGRYPSNLERTETVKVERGLILSLQFTAFDIYYCAIVCLCDHLTIMDGDGTILMGKSCGPNIGSNIVIGGNVMESSLPTAIISTSNIVNLMFSSDGGHTWPGWSLSWSAVTPGERQTSDATKAPGPPAW